MSTFNLTLLIFELKRQLSAIKQKQELFLKTYQNGFTEDVKKELWSLEQKIESLTLQIQLLEE